MGIGEIIAVVFSLICVILTIRRNIWCWVTGMVGVVFYAYVFYDTKLYADMVLQAVYFAQSIYGMEMWVRNGGMDKKVKVVRLEMMDMFMHGAILMGTWLLIAYLMFSYTDNSIPAIDAFLSVASLFANYYLAKRILESWFIWIVVDIGYIGVFLYKDLYLSSGLYFVFLIMAIYGLLEWKKELNTKKVSY
jgi:nicotinamide mononucleotide transporter